MIESLDNLKLELELGEKGAVNISVFIYGKGKKLFVIS